MKTYIRSARIFYGAVIACAVTVPAPMYAQANLDSSAWYNLVNQNSQDCVDASGWGKSNGTPVIQWQCGTQQGNQQWQFVPTNSGYYKLLNRNAVGEVLDVVGQGINDGTIAGLWSDWQGPNQQWMPVTLGNGYYKLVGRQSGRCLDVPGASTVNGAALQIYDCNGTGAQAFQLVGGAAGATGAETFAPSGRGGSLLPAGYLSTRGSQIVDASGTAVRIASIGWYGTDGPAGAALQGLWTVSYGTILQSIKDDGFNTVRIPWSNADLHTPFAGTNELGGVDWTANADLRGLTTLQVFQKIVDAAGKIGLKVIFDHHTDDGGGGQQPNGLWIDKGPGTDNTDDAGHTGTVDAAKFFADWVEVAQTFAGNSTVIGFDLDNEPLGNHSTWGDGAPTDIRVMYQDVGNAVEAADPGVLIIAEGLIEPRTPLVARTDGQQDYVQTLIHIKDNPVVLSASKKLVYSIHDYPKEIGGQSLDNGSAVVQQKNTEWGFVLTQGIAPVWIGEMGSSMVSTDSQAWASTLLDYMNGKDGSQGGPVFAKGDQPISGSWWNAGSDDNGNPDGNQTAWGLGNYRPEQQAVTDQILFRP